MKVAIIGASGHLGAEITQEALSRGHLVTGISRNIGVLPEHPQLRTYLDRRLRRRCARAGDRGKRCGHSCLQSRPRAQPIPDIFEKFVAGHEAILAAVKQASHCALVVRGRCCEPQKPETTYRLSTRPSGRRCSINTRDGIRGTRELYYLLQKDLGRGLDLPCAPPSC